MKIIAEGKLLMAHKVIPQDPDNRIILIELSKPFDARSESTQITHELQEKLGAITDIVYIIYDFREVSFSFADIITGVSGFARQQMEFEKQLAKYSRLILVGLRPMVSIGAKSMARFSPGQQFPVFETPEEAVAYATTERAKQVK